LDSPKSQAREATLVGRGGSPRPLVATGVKKKLNRESREQTRKEDEDFEKNVGRGGSPRRLVATGVR